MTLRELVEKLDRAMNAVAGCAMFAPDALRKRDLPGLIDDMNEAQYALFDKLEDEGLI